MKERYFHLVGLEVAQQRMLFNGKVMSDEDNLHIHLVLLGVSFIWFDAYVGGGQGLRRLLYVQRIQSEQIFKRITTNFTRYE